ncbi:MAG TPA: NUDIX domain-containing protein [Bacteroidia bacterium]|nr:NUDIX domain-containing protein [Bacteroidia bacterium]
MYKVFINNHPLHIIGVNDDVNEIPGTLLLSYDSEKTLDELLNLAHAHKNFFKQVYLFDEKPEKVFEILQSRCRLIDAAGGLVKNAKDELLMIFRNGKWDLPKGKLEKNETPEVAAIREVEEECGIEGLTVIKTLEPTYHTYILKEKIVLKKTYWFEMFCTDEKELIPQTAEGITEAKWMNPSEVEKALGNTFFSIIDVVKEK